MFFFVSDKLFGFEMAPGAFSRFLGSNSGRLYIYISGIIFMGPTTRGGVPHHEGSLPEEYNKL